MPPLHTACITAVTRKQGPYHLVQVTAPAMPTPLPGQYLRLDGVAWPVLGRDRASIEVFAAQPAPAMGAKVTMEGPLGEILRPDGQRPALLIGDSAGLPALIYLYNQLAQVPCLSLLTLESPAPFKLQPSLQLVPGMPAEAIATLGLLENAVATSRIASSTLVGCYDGTVLDLLTKRWDVGGLEEVMIYACGEATLMTAAQEWAAARRVTYQGVTAVWAGLNAG